MRYKNGAINNKKVRLATIERTLDAMASFYRRLDNCEKYAIALSSVVDKLQKTIDDLENRG